MKKLFKLFSWVVCINLMAVSIPWVALAEEGSPVSGDPDAGAVVDDSPGEGEVGEEVGNDIGGEDGASDDDEGDDDAENDDENMDEDENELALLPSLYIRAINPGYKIDGVSEVGEMIEIGKSSDDLISLAGVTVRYTNSSGKTIDLVEFPENSLMSGENLVLRYDKSPGSELSNVTYNATLALKAGPVALLVDGEVVDSVCWTNKGDCVRYFETSNATTLVRNLTTGEFEHVKDYEPEYDAASLSIISDDDSDVTQYDDEELDAENLSEKPDDDGKNDFVTEVEEAENEDKNPVEEEVGEVVVVKQCLGLVFSEMLSYYTESQAEQFVEFYNGGAQPVTMDGCVLRYKNKTYDLHGEVGKGEYAVRWATDFKLTKNPTGSNVLELVDIDGETVDVLEYYNGQKKGAAWALVSREAEEGIWQVTYAVTPGQENVEQEYRSCEEGKVINELTGKCVKAEDDEEPLEKVCAEGQYLNPLTGRCKKIEDEAEEKTCKEGYYLNEETGRCRKIVVAAAKVCAEGYYLNEETGRCRKIVENNGAKYELEEETFAEESSFIALYAVLGVAGLGVVYVVWEFRKEIGRGLKKLFGRNG